MMQYKERRKKREERERKTLLPFVFILETLE